jgi:hypothetical protein
MKIKSPPMESEGQKTLIPISTSIKTSLNISIQII